MTGIERLRELSKGMHNHRVTVWQLTDDAYEERFGVTKHGPTIKNFLSDIADQIERETKTSSEVEKMKCGPDDVSMSAYDLLPADEREAIAWVREHGGLDHVKAEWCSRVPHDLYERRRQRLLGHIAECEAALGLRRVRIGELGHRVGDLTNENAELRRRAMPEGYEWPRYKDDDLVRIGDMAVLADGSPHEVESIEFFANKLCKLKGKGTLWMQPVFNGKRVKRAPVLAADGIPLEVGQTVWSVNDGREYKVVTVESPVQFDTTSIKVDDGKAACGVWIRPDNLTHQRPVLDVDGVLIREGDTVWFVGGGEPAEVAYTITADASHPDEVVLKGYEDDWPVNADKLTHTKPEPPDSWERIEEDKDLNPFDYCKKVGHKLWTFDNAEEFKASDLVRRCRALAEHDAS